MSNAIPPDRAGTFSTAVPAAAPAAASAGPAASPSAEKDLLERFFAAFARRDYRGMGACYHPSIAFRDPIFKLKGRKVSAMWHMLCEGGKDMRIEASGIRADDGLGRAHWSAAYTFSATGRKVVNSVDSRFTFKDGLILDQRDDFSFWNWSRQALGPAGLFLGWMPRLLQTVQEKANGNLAKFLAAHPEYGER